MEHTISKSYHTAIYLRLSKEDSDMAAADKSESNSISNQKAYILDFLKSKPELTVCGTFADDGYSGVDFDRPEFQKMLEKIKNREINCVVVKDLSRFGRNYIEAGKYIEKLFPLLGVRFIAINDHYDSQNTQDNSIDMIVPFKNLINDAYCRDISIKIRSHLDIKRKNGEFIGAFTVYGYKKSEENKNKLVIDECAAENVRNIFRMRIQGMSNQTIADKLNDLGILSPLEYKKQEGIHFSTVFQTYSKTKWSATSVGRILKNQIYTGVLIQGKESTPNYKIKKRIKKGEVDWIRFEDAHEPIVNKSEFDTVQRLLQEDTRVLAEEDTVALYAGCIKCADCGNSMVRKTVPAGKKDADGIQRKYVYYVCSGNKNDKTFCSPHRISEAMLDEAVLYTVREHISHIFSLKNAMEYLKDVSAGQKNIKYLDIRISQLKEEADKYQDLKFGLYVDMREGILSKEEFIKFGSNFEQKIIAAQTSIRQLEDEIESALNQKSEKQLWMNEFLEHKNITKMTRKIVVHLIYRIYIYEDNRLEIEFQYEEQLQAAMKLLEMSKESTQEQIVKLPKESDIPLVTDCERQVV
jgi:DNA invertase Pin-like site-specific DNA recombinase